MKLVERRRAGRGAASRARVALLALVLASGGAADAATLVVIDKDAPGVGFNDPMPVAPVGGNTGLTLGQQRLIAFRHAADIWGAQLASRVTITIQAQFVPLACTASGAVLASAGTTQVFADFAGAQRPGTWYPFALANRLAGADQDPGVPQIAARFNANLGQAGCLEGAPFYLGLDNQHGGNIDLVATVLHELGHGLGFQTYTDTASGTQLRELPSIWDHFLTDTTTNRTWADMSDAERAASAVNARRLAWGGPLVAGAVPGVLGIGTPRLAISGPAAGPATGDMDVGVADFGAALSAYQPVSGQIMPVVDQPDGSGLACDPLGALNRVAVRGHLALVDRGGCDFVVKARNVQDAGALGLIVADNVIGAPPPGLTGNDPAVTIPAVRIAQADAAVLKARLRSRSRTGSGVIGNLGVNSSQYTGADIFGRVLMYTPNPLQGGSSVSHFDTSAFPNLLLEPSINADLSHSVLPPKDLTLRLLQDIGW